MSVEGDNACSTPGGGAGEVGEGRHILGCLTEGGKTLEKVTAFCINTIHTKILLSLRLQLILHILCFVESELKNSVNGVKNLCNPCGATVRPLTRLLFKC